MHGLPMAPTFQDTVDGYPRQVWRNTQGEDLIEILCHLRHGPWHPALRPELPTTSAVPPELFCSRSEFPPPIASAKFWGLAQATHKAAAKDSKPVRKHPPTAIAIDQRPVRPPVPPGAPPSSAVDIRGCHHPGLESCGADEDGLTGRLRHCPKPACVEYKTTQLSAAIGMNEHARHVPAARALVRD